MAKTARQYWLMKSEPDVYSIDMLKKEGSAHWDGVRNPQARNFMRDQMSVGDLVLFYHSNANPPGAAGIARVCKQGYPDHTQFDPGGKHFDPMASEDEPRWYMVDVEFVEKFGELLLLKTFRDDPAFEGMPLVRKFQRLSVQPVERKHFQRALKLAGAKTRA